MPTTTKAPKLGKAPKLSPELARFERGAMLGTRLMEEHVYEVQGTGVLHQVDITDREDPSCDCVDFKLRRRNCKHIWACLLREGDVRARKLNRDLLSTLRVALSGKEAE